MEYKTIFIWEAIGFLFIVIAGILLHFCFEWSGNFTPLALFCSVNESVWEHFKLGFWPSLFYALLEYVLWGSKANNFLPAKAIALYLIPIIIAVLFYGYTSILGRHVLVLDILIFIIAVFLSQYVSYKVITSDKDLSGLNNISLVLITVITLAFSLFSFCPPSCDLFLDPRTGKPGIQG